MATREATYKEIRAKLKEEAGKRARLRKQERFMQALEERQAKKTAAPGTMKGQQVDTTISPFAKKAGQQKAEPKKPEPKKPEPKKFSPKKEEVKTYQDSKPNQSNAPNPFKPRKVEEAAPTKKEMTIMEKAKDIIGVGREATEKEKMGRALQDNAIKSMGMGSRFGYNNGGHVKRNMRDGIAVRGKTKGKLY